LSALSWGEGKTGRAGRGSGNEPERAGPIKPGWSEGATAPYKK